MSKVIGDRMDNNIIMTDTPITIAVASGKGGTGKTTVAVALALALARGGEAVALLDADVEAPNAHLFLGAQPQQPADVTLPVPVVDESLCTNCGKCREVCAFHAIIMLGDAPLIFPELCHGCGGCTLACPENAITETPITIGWLESADTNDLAFMRGRLKVGEAKSPPIIRALRDDAPKRNWTIIDAPPGTSCPVIGAVRGTDFALLVTEPTPFGLNDLMLAVGMVRALDLPFGVIVNRAGLGDEAVQAWCEAENIPLLLEIPFSKHVAKTYANGGTLLDADPIWKKNMQNLAASLASRRRQ